MWTAANKKELTPMQLDKSVVQSVCCRRKQQLKAVTHASASVRGLRPGAVVTAFCVGDDSRTPHVSKHLTRGGAEEKRTRYAARLGGSSRIIRAAGHIIKPRGRRCPTRHMMILLDRGEAPSLSAPYWGRGVFG